MKKLLQWMFLLMLMGSVGLSQAQNNEFRCDFETDTDTAGWVFVNGTQTNYWVIDTAANNTENGSQCLYVTKDSTHANVYNHNSRAFVCAYKEITLDAGIYDVSYDWRVNGEGSSYSKYDYMRVLLVPTTATITAGTKPYGFDSGVAYQGKSLDGGSALLKSASWNSFTGELTISTSGTFRLACFWVNDASGGADPSAAIDNIVIKAQTCPSPMNFAATDLTFESATLDWTEMGEAAEWQIEYGPVGFTRGSGTVVDAIYDHPYTLTDLDDNTAYDAYLVSVCSSDDSSKSVKTTFRTECGVMELPYLENFDGTNSGEFPFCWFKKSGSASATSSNAYSGNSLKFAASAVVYSPKVTIPANEAGVYFAAKAESAERSGVMEVGYVTDTAIWDYHSLRTIVPIDNQYHMYEIDLDEVDCSDNVYIVFSQKNPSGTYWYWWIDDVNIFQLGECRMPTNFIYNNITDNSATITWESVSSGASFEILLNNIIYTVDDGSNTYTFTGLEPNTVYCPMVRTMCDDADSSYWQEGGMFITEPACVDVEDLFVSGITEANAVVSWRYVEHGFAHTGATLKYKADTATVWTEVNVSGNSYILSGLTPETSYQVSVTTTCDENSSDEVTCSFTTESGICGEITGMGSLSTNVPLGGYYKYSFSESIYPSSVVARIDSIKGIQYHSASFAQTRDITVYIGNTTLDEFSSTSDYIPLANLTQVYNGNYDFSGSNWDSILFSTPFVSNGENIIIAVTDQTGSYNSDRVAFYYHNGSTIYKNTDNHAINPASDYLYQSSNVPDVRFIGECEDYTCKAPIVSVASSDATTITFAWQAGLDESSWTVDYRMFGSEDWISFNSYVTDTFIVIDGLLPGESYEARVGSLCSDDTLYSSIVGYTTCQNLTIPYFTNFNSGMLNSCWRIGSIIANGDQPEVRLDRLNIESHSYVIMSAFEDAINSLQVRFKMEDSEDGVIYVGVCTEPNNISTFVPIDTVMADPLDPTADIIARLSSYEGEGLYITLMAGMHDVHIDDLYVEFIPSCPTPIHLSVTAMGGTSVSLGWDGDPVATAWNATLVTSGSDVAEGTVVNCTEATVTFTDLLPNTTYDVYVNAECSGASSDATMITFTTLGTDPLSLPYSIDFSDATENAKWTLYSRTGNNKWAIGNAVSNNTPNALYVSKDAGASNEYQNNSISVAMAYIPIQVSEEGTYALSYDWKVDGENGWDFGRAALVPSTYDFTTAPATKDGYKEGLPAGWIQYDNGRLEDNLSWSRCVKKTNLAAGTYMLTFVWANDGSGGSNPPVAIDNVSLSLITCPDPVAVNVVDITATSATLTWRSDEMVNNGWEVSIDGSDPIAVMDTFYVFDNLTAGVSHTATVKALCSESDASLTITRNFVTECADISVLPYANNFDDIEFNEIPNCWYSNGSYPYVTNHQLKFYCSSYGFSQNIISLPRLSSSVDMSLVELSLRARTYFSYGTHYLYVGVCSTPMDYQSFTAVDTITLSNTMEDYVISYNNYTDTGRYISLMVNRGSNYSEETYVDDLVLQMTSPCARPIAANFVSHTHKEATVAWVDTNDNASFRLALGRSNNIAAIDTIIEGIVSSPYTFTGLQGSTTYHAWIATECSVYDTVSSWVYIGSITTDPTCGKVVDLDIYDIDESHATLVWQNPSSGEPVTSYIVSCQKNNNAPVLDTVQERYYFLSNLDQDSNYTVKVTTLCDSVVSSANTVTFVPEPLPGCNSIGNGTGTTSYVPLHSNYNYSFSEMIFTADEMSTMGDTIHGVTFKHFAPYTTKVRNVKVYIANTNDSVFTSSCLPVNTMDSVYIGTLSFSSTSTYIDFTTPFVRNHNQNIVLAIDDNTGDYNGSVSFYYTLQEQNRSIYKYRDGADIDDATEGFTATSFRPNVVFDASCEPITCFPPSIVITDLSDTAMSLVWRAGADETAWSVEYRTLPYDWVTVSANTTATNATINGLYPGTEYQVRVGSLCSNDVVYRTMNVTTECGPMPTPFSENFEYVELGNFDKTCWVADGNNRYARPKVANVMGNGNMVCLEDFGYVILPEIQGNLNELQLRFRYLSIVDSAMIVVAYTNYLNDITLATPIDTLYDVNNVSGTYHTIMLNNLPDNAMGHLVLYSPQDFAQVAIDDIIVEPIRTCVEPTDVQITNITTTSATVSWNGTASNYVVEYGEMGYKIRGEVGTTMPVNTTSLNLTGLTAGTSYDVYVRSVCGANDSSYFTNTVSFTSECAPVASFPYVMNFELAYLPPVYESRMVPNCWTIAEVDTSNDEASHPQVVSQTLYQNFAVNGTNALRIEDNSLLALPEMNVDVDTLNLRFFMRALNPDSRVLVGVLDHIGAGCASTFQVVDTIEPVNARENNPYSVYFRNYTGSGKYIAIRCINSDGSMNTSTIHFDSVVVDYIPACPEVINVRSTVVTGSTVTLDWDDVVAPAANYEVVYGESGFDISVDGTSLIANTHPFTISGLENITNYDFWVRPICGDGDTGMFGFYPLVVKTSVCDNPVPFTTAPNGSNATSDLFPMAGWYGHSYSQTIIDASYLAGMTDITAFTLTEALSSNGKMNGIQVWLNHTDKTSFSSITDYTHTDSMQLVYTGNLEYDDGLVTVLFDSIFLYNGSSNLMVTIVRDANAYEHGHFFETVVDSVATTIHNHVDWDELNPNALNDAKSGLANAHAAFTFISCGAGCPKPVLTSVTDLTYESATINWVAAPETNYEVAIRAESETSMSTPVAVAGGAYTFNNLTPNVTYYYYVRQVCDETEFSDWAEGSFITDDLPCFTPTDIAVVSTTAESITLSWNAAEGQSKWAIHAFNTIEDHTDTVTVNPGTITGLTGGLTYNVAVSAICATNYVSDWSDTIEVATADCEPVSDVTVSNITENSATVTWTAGANESAWEINYGESDFGQGQGEFAETTTNTYTITDLEANSDYDVYVRAICSDDFYSIWSDVVSFTTLDNDTPEGIDGVDGNFQFSIYPNPTSNATTISLNGVDGKVEISIVDMNGRMIQTETIECGSNCEKRVDVTNLAQGTYFVRVLGNDINSVRKLIVR